MKRYEDYTKDDLMRLLESLTPGGSEFHESPENCARFIRERKGKPYAAPDLLAALTELSDAVTHAHVDGEGLISGCRVCDALAISRAAIAAAKGEQ